MNSNLALILWIQTSLVVSSPSANTSLSPLFTEFTYGSPRRLAPQVSLIMVATCAFLANPQVQAVLGGVGAGLLVTVSFQGAVSRARRPRRGLFVRRRPKLKCPKCGGFGIVRCNLCDGKGFVERQTPMYDVILCPKCVSHRHVDCDMCLGTGIRPDTDFNIRLLLLRLFNLIMGLFTLLTRRLMRS